jgi:hypothetical protein
MARPIASFWLATVMCAAVACSPSQEERAQSAADRAAVGARSAMRGLTYEEVEGSVDCAQDCSGQAAGFAYALDHHIENDADCNNPSRSFVEGCEAYGQEIDQCLSAAREAVMQGKQPADRCPLVAQHANPG